MYAPYHAPDEGNSHLRNQFMSNTNSHGASRYTTPSQPQYPPQEHTDTQSISDSFIFDGNAGTSKQLPYPPSSSYANKEMPPRPDTWDLPSGPSGPSGPDPSSQYQNRANDAANSYLPETPLMNPFHSTFDSSYDPNPPHPGFPKTQTTGIPFGSPKHDQTSFNEYPLLDYPDKPQPPLPEPVSDEYDRLRRNEKNRLKQLRRKPRFHYTRLPYLTILLSTIQVIVFIVELVRMSKLTGSAFQTKPYFNPMLGPSTYVLINMGARYVPCMHQIEGITDDPSIAFPCANSTSVDTNVCALNQLCGLSGVPLVDDKFIPGQWYRIFVPIFLHAGFLHIIFNLLLQVTMGSTIERQIGFIKYFIIYMLSGIGGFLLGSNYSPDGIASTGCSGALFGIMATNLVMFAYCGRKNTNLYGTKHYALFVCIMVAEIIVSLVLGLLPGLDNFSHIGGFAMGLLTSVLLLPDPFFVYIDGIITYNASDNTWQQAVNNWNPLHHFDDKIPVRVYAWCAARVTALALIIVYFTTLSKHFFNDKLNSPDDKNCKWCKYINCIPVHGWCNIGEVTVSTSGPSSTQSPSSSASSTISQPTAAPTTSLPSSIENGDAPKRRRRQYNQVLAKSFEPVPQNKPQISGSDSFVESQSVGLGLYIVLAFFTFSFLKKKLGSHN